MSAEQSRQPTVTQSQTDSPSGVHPLRGSVPASGNPVQLQAPFRTVSALSALIASRKAGPLGGDNPFAMAYSQFRVVGSLIESISASSCRFLKTKRSRCRFAFDVTRLLKRSLDLRFSSTLTKADCRRLKKTCALYSSGTCA